MSDTDLPDASSAPSDIAIDTANGNGKHEVGSLVRHPNANGGMLKVGNPGNKGGRGGDHNAVRKQLSQLVGNRKVQAYLKRLLVKPPDADTFLKAFHEAFDRAHGKAVQPVSGPDGGPIPIEHVFVHLPPKDPEP